MPIKTTKATAQPLPIIAPPQNPQTVGGITTMSASVAPPAISSQINGGQGIKATPNTAPQTINAGTDKYMGQGMGNQQAYEQSMKDFNVSQWPAPVGMSDMEPGWFNSTTPAVSPATPNKPIVPEVPAVSPVPATWPTVPETPPVPAGWAPMVTPPKPATTEVGQTQGTTGIYDGATPDQKSQADSMYNLIDPSQSLSPEARNDIRDAIASGDVSKIQAIANAYWIDAKQTASFISAYRTTRDADLTSRRADEVNQRNLDQTKQSYDDAIAKQKANVEATANNMAIMQETGGRMQSRNMANGIIQAMNEQQRILHNLHQSKDWAFAELASNAEYNHKILANNYNDAMSQFDSQIQAKIKNLADTGMAKTADGLKMAQSAIEQAQLKKLELGNQYAQSLQQAVEITKMQIAQKTADPEQTKLINDWYLHNAMGEVVMWPTGKPLTYNTAKEIKQIVDDGKGGKLAVYADGTTSQVTEGQVASPEEIQNYVKAIQQNPQLFNGLSDSIKPQVLAALGKSVSAPSEASLMGYAYEVAKSGINAIKDLPPEAQNKVLELYANMSSDERMGVKKGSRNVTKMTDAMGNEILIDTDTMRIVYWPGSSSEATGWTSSTPTDSSLMQMLASGKAGGSKFFGVYASGDPTGENRKNAYEAMAKTGIAADLAKFPTTKITEGMIEAASQKTGIDPLMIATILKLDSSYGTAGKGARNNNPGNVGQFDSLDAKGITVKGYDTLQEGIDAVALNLKKRYDALPEIYKQKYSPEEIINTEGVTEGVKSFAQSAMSGGLTTNGTPAAQKEYTATQKVLFDKFLTGKDDANDQKALRRLGFTDADINAYAASIPETTELSDKKFTQYNQVLSKFVANPEVKSFEAGMNSYGDLISSLKNANWPGDVAAIFQFMKTLDPSSTVREGEFALAAKSAGVWEQFKQIPANKLEGTILSEEQRKAFGKLALKFIENKAKAYDTKYEDMKRIFKEQGIPETYLPTKVSEHIKQYSGEEIQTESGNTYDLNDF